MTKLAQRYARAVGSTDLHNDEYHSDTDVLAAVALSSALGATLFRVKYFNDPHSYYRILDDWRRLVARKAALRHWPEHIDVDEVARRSLRYWLHDRCAECDGRGYYPVPGTPMLSDKACRRCGGSGREPLAVPKVIADYVHDMVEELHDMERSAGARAMKKLKKQLEW